MALTARQKLGAFLYATLFCIVLPILLVLWAGSTDDVVQMQPYGTPIGGAVLILAGALLMMLGFVSLWRRGGGLPMNAFPPQKLVTTGVYHWLPHPIYLGFALGTFGVAMAAQSPSGLWLVAPAVMLGCAALVWGFERPDLERRFPHAAREYLWLPAATNRSPAGMARIRCYLFLLLPWVAIYEIIVWSGAPKDAFTMAFPFERNLPISAWAEPIYVSTYIVVGLTPLLARTSQSLRDFMIRSWLAMAIAFSLYLALPVLAPHKPFTGTGFWGLALEMERTADPPLNAFPSFHTIWAFLTVELLVVGRAWWTRCLWRAWAIGIAISCVATGQHWIADVVAGIILSFALIRLDLIWGALLRFAEWMANSWHEWRIGPVRIINHSIYAALASGIALLIVGTLIGPGREPVLLFTAAAALLGAAMWAQWIEGSSQLLRPFGWYGGVIGVALACLAAPLLGTPVMLIGAAYCVAAPWMQAIGRLRCLVQGCCHGRPTSDHIGIRYVHPNSRVTQLSGFTNEPLHATPLYSILWNIFSAIVLARMWWAGCELHVIAGIFALVNGMGRFVEEAYRGEPQTPIFFGLRLYQWMATLSVIAGAILTTLPMHGEAPKPQFSITTLLIAAAVGLISGIALGVDIPSSNRRFSRLA